MLFLLHISEHEQHPLTQLCEIRLGSSEEATYSTTNMRAVGGLLRSLGAFAWLEKTLNSNKGVESSEFPIFESSGLFSQTSLGDEEGSARSRARMSNCH